MKKLLLSLIIVASVLLMGCVTTEKDNNHEDLFTPIDLVVDESPQDKEVPADWEDNLDKYEVQLRGPGVMALVDKETGAEYEFDRPWYLMSEMCELSVREDMWALVNIETGEEYPIVSVDVDFNITSNEGFNCDVTMTRLSPFITGIEYYIHFIEKRNVMYGSGGSKNTQFKDGDSVQWHFEDLTPRYPFNGYLIWSVAVDIEGSDRVRFRNEAYANDSHWGELGFF